MPPKIMASGLQFPEGPVVDRDGSLLIVEIERRTITRVKDGKTSILATMEGGPNGLAWGPDGALYLCNNGGFLFTKAADGGNRVKPGVPEGYAGGRIERIDPKTGERRVLYTHCGEHNLVGPNDLVFDGQGGFYFTDYGKFYPRHRVNGGLYYALADGSKIVEVAYPLITPNGVGPRPTARRFMSPRPKPGASSPSISKRPARPGAIRRASRPMAAASSMAPAAISASTVSRSRRAATSASPPS